MLTIFYCIIFHLFNLSLSLPSMVKITCTCAIFSLVFAYLMLMLIYSGPCTGWPTILQSCFLPQNSEWPHEGLVYELLVDIELDVK